MIIVLTGILFRNPHISGITHSGNHKGELTRTAGVALGATQVAGYSGVGMVKLLSTIGTGVGLLRNPFGAPEVRALQNSRTLYPGCCRKNW